jgi:nucleoside phosphorylase
VYVCDDSNTYYDHFDNYGRSCSLLSSTSVLPLLCSNARSAIDHLAAGDLLSAVQPQAVLNFYFEPPTPHSSHTIMDTSLYLTHDDYTVACICPMGVELAPVEAMLDEMHPSLPTSRDQNSYTLGRIGVHNVVIAVMPEIGNNSAAVVATQLLNDFRSIRFGLLVGIGGGIPGDEDDIRLGDVVVSKPTDTFGGVVQFDRGKTHPNGQFERTGILRKPPAMLMATVQKLQARQKREGNKISQYLWEMLERFPNMEEERYIYPGVEHDQLFVASYIHEAGKSCQQCDRRKAIERTPRKNTKPRIHYGTIGSANAVIKDSETRDRLRRDLGILCVEMEAAGLMDEFSCLVIRGICDYADSHKNKKWQPYAAATAAAFAKELLLIIPAQEIVATTKAADAFQGTPNP